MAGAAMMALAGAATAIGVAGCAAWPDLVTTALNPL